MTRSLSRPAGLLLGAVVALAALACGGDAAKTEDVRPPVTVRRAIARNVVDRIQATGQLLAREEAVVAAQVGGQITGIAVEEGAAVDQGQVVVEIDPERRQLELEDARARAVQARAELGRAGREAHRIEKLAAQNAASKARLDQARTQLDMARSGLAAAEARLGLAQRALDDAAVRAPFAGRLAERRVNVGEFVNVGQPLFHLVALDPVEVEFFLAERDSSRVARGQKVEVHVASYPDEVFSAEVSVVSPTIERDTRTRRVKALLPNPDGRLLPGNFAEVDLGVAERQGVVMIPKEAVLQRADGSVVFRLRGPDRVERLRVETGVFRDDLVEVRGPVADGDWIVTRGQTALIDGSAVSLRNEDGTPFDAARLGPHDPERDG